jgi:hypothetical protein
MFYTLVTQLVECHPLKLEVPSSSLGGGTYKNWSGPALADIAQFVERVFSIDEVTDANSVIRSFCFLSSMDQSAWFRPRRLRVQVLQGAPFGVWCSSRFESWLRHFVAESSNGRIPGSDPGNSGFKLALPTCVHFRRP